MIDRVPTPPFLVRLKVKINRCNAKFKQKENLMEIKHSSTSTFPEVTIIWLATPQLEQSRVLRSKYWYPSLAQSPNL